MIIYLAVKEREKAQKLADQKKFAEASSKLPAASKKGGIKKSGTATPSKSTDARQLDLSALNLDASDGGPVFDEPPPKITIAREKVLEEATKALQAQDSKQNISLVVIGEI